MRYFAKYFLISLGIQVVLLIFVLLTGIADYVLFLFYALPYLFFDMVIKLPDQIGGDSVIILFFLLCIPAVIYSLLIGVAATIFNLIANRKT